MTKYKTDIAKSIFKSFITLFAFSIFLFAQEEFVFDEESMFPMEEDFKQEKDITIEPLSVYDSKIEEQEQYIELKREDLEFNLNYDNNMIVRYDTIPKKVFLKQHFEVVLNATIATNDFDTILISLENGHGYELISKDLHWSEDSNRLFKNRVIFKANEENIIMPNIIVSLVKDNMIVEEYKLEKLNINVLKVGQHIEHFSHVIAKDLKLTSHITKQYDNNTFLNMIEIEAINSNLEDFYLKNYNKQGIEYIDGDFNKQKLVYFIILPIHEDSLILSYYNTNKDKLEIISSPIIHTEEIVSTQTDLNPLNSNWLWYKKIAISVLLTFCFIWLIFSRSKFSISVFIVVLAIFIYLFMPNSKIMLKEGTNIFILPTKSSSVFLQTHQDNIVEVLDSHKGFIKVLLPDNKIGWVYEKDISKD